MQIPLSAIDFEPPPTASQPAPQSYPGSAATAASLLLLADEYCSAANLLLGAGRRGAAASYAPFRLTAIHAIELYLSGFLLDCGETPAAIRALGHNLGARAARAIELGLVLRQRTRIHMESLTGGREYLVSRYAVDLLSSMSQINQLTSSLEEISGKVRRRLTTPKP